MAKSILINFVIKLFIGVLCHCRTGSKVQCLIFVERIITAKVIEIHVKKVRCLSHLTVSYVTGSNGSAEALSPKLQKETMESFCSGKVPNLSHH